MKRDSTLIILLVSFLLIFSGAYIFLESKRGVVETNQQKITPTPALDRTQEKTSQDTSQTDSKTENATSSSAQDLETVPTVSQDVDLETIEEELNNTQILEEDFSEL